MQNKKYFSLSWPLRECFKNVIGISGLSFVMYFFAGIFPVLSNLKHIRAELYNRNLFANLFTAYGFLIIAPVVSASIAMGYLH